MLLTNHSMTLRPPLCYPLQVSSSSPPHLLVFWGTVKRDEEWRSESSQRFSIYLPQAGECQGAGALESAVLSVSRGELG